MAGSKRQPPGQQAFPSACTDAACAARATCRPLRHPPAHVLALLPCSTAEEEVERICKHERNYYYVLHVKKDTPKVGSCAFFSFFLFFFFMCCLPTMAHTLLADDGLAAPIGWRRLLLLPVTVGCWRWLLLLAAVGCHCWLLPLLLAAAPAVCCTWRRLRRAGCSTGLQGWAGWRHVSCRGGRAAAPCAPRRPAPRPLPLMYHLLLCCL